MVGQRLRGWEAHHAPNLRVLTRDTAPPLTDRATWQQFPVDQYDVVFLDSLGASTEGISEKEGRQTQEILATLKDIARRGPALVVLDNTIKSGENIRGRGEKGDAIDVLYEARNITGWTPPLDDHWWEHLPDEGAHTWKQRASRRHGQAILRLAFIPAKFRLGIEPDPFCMEMDLTRTPYTLRDITDILLAEGTTQARETRDAELRKLEDAAFALCRELKQRPHDNPLLVGDAEEFLVAVGLRWTQARNLLRHGENGIKWEIRHIPGRRGKAKGVCPLGEDNDVQNNQAS